MKITPPKVAAWSALAAIIFVTASPISMRPSDFLPVNVDRALAFGVLSTLLVLAYPRQWKWAFAAAIVGPSLIELLQLFSPTRHAHLEDAVVKSAGAIGGAFVGASIRWLHEEVTAKRQVSVKRRVGLPPGVNAAFKHMPVTSRMIEAIYFSQEDGQLRICLKNGNQRLFEGVTESEATAIATAPSPGNHYLTEFKPRHKRAA
jgi:hypothetical protein